LEHGYGIYSKGIDFLSPNISLCFIHTSEGNPWLRHSSHPWHLARPPAAAALAYFFKEQEVGGS